MDRLAIYSMFLISIYILYLAIKSKMTICPYDTPKPKVPEPIPIKVSDIFRSMFQDREPVPGHIGLGTDQDFVPPAPSPVDSNTIKLLAPVKL